MMRVTVALVSRPKFVLLMLRFRVSGDKEARRVGHIERFRAELHAVFSLIWKFLITEASQFQYIGPSMKNRSLLPVWSG